MSDSAQTRASVSLALGGGGGKGIVHIGVLQAIESSGLDIASIVGTSIGAVWSALLAKTIVNPGGAGPRTQAAALTAVEQLAYQLQFRNFRDLDVLRGFTKGFVRGDKFEKWLGTMLWHDVEKRLLTFADLAPFDLTVTATNAQTGESIVCNDRLTPDLAIARAVRASMSIQGFFREITLEIPGSGKMQAVPCWDGGTTGNCRFDLSLRFRPALPVIASSLTYRGEAVWVDKGLLRAAWRLSRVRDHTISILMRQNEAILLENLDPDGRRVLLIQPPLSGIGTFDLDIPGARKSAAIVAARTHASTVISAFRKAAGF